MAIAMTVKAAIEIISVILTVRMEPKKKASALVWSRPDEMRVIAVPMERERTMVKMRSRWWGKNLRRNSIMAPQTEVKRKAPMIGLDLHRRPRVIPAREAWDIVSPIMEDRRRTMKMPIQGQRREMQMATKRAFCIKV